MEGGPWNVRGELAEGRGDTTKERKGGRENRKKKERETEKGRVVDWHGGGSRLFGGL